MDEHDFSLFRQHYAHPEAEDRFLNIDQQWLERQLQKKELRTIIIDNTKEQRQFSVRQDKETQYLALVLENPKGGDMVCLGLSLFRIPTNITYLKFRNVQLPEQVPPADILLNAFLNRKLSCIYLEKKIDEKFMLTVIAAATRTDKILVRCSNTTDKALKKLLDTQIFVIGSDDESSEACVPRVKRNCR